MLIGIVYIHDFILYCLCFQNAYIQQKQNHQYFQIQQIDTSPSFRRFSLLLLHFLLNGIILPKILTKHQKSPGVGGRTHKGRQGVMELYKYLFVVHTFYIKKTFQIIYLILLESSLLCMLRVQLRGKALTQHVLDPGFYPCQLTPMYVHVYTPTLTHLYLCTHTYTHTHADMRESHTYAHRHIYTCTHK